MERDPRTGEPGPDTDKPRVEAGGLRAQPGQRAATRVLMLEASARDAALIQHHLGKAGMAVEALRVQTRRGFVSALRTFEPDVVLSDCVLPDFSGLEAVKLVRELAPDIPVIIVSGILADNIVVNLLEVGAHDYVLKDRLARLASAVLRALCDVRTRRLREEIEAGQRSSRFRFQAHAEDALV